MNASPKIVVVKMREIIYTILLLFLVAALILCLVLMFSGKSTSSQNAASSGNEKSKNLPAEDSGSSDRLTYTPGIYTVPVSLGESSAEIQVTVDANHINSIRLVNLSESTSAAFPLVSPSLDHLASQILEKQNLEGITCPSENRYTSQILLSAIADALSIAQNPG